MCRPTSGTTLQFLTHLLTNTMNQITWHEFTTITSLLLTSITKASDYITLLLLDSVELSGCCSWPVHCTLACPPYGKGSLSNSFLTHFSYLDHYTFPRQINLIISEHLYYHCLVLFYTGWHFLFPFNWKYIHYIYLSLVFLLLHLSA